MSEKQLEAIATRPGAGPVPAIPSRSAPVESSFDLSRNIKRRTLLPLSLVSKLQHTNQNQIKMPPRINTFTIIASSVALAAGAYTAATYRRISTVRSAAITTTHSISPSFQASKAVHLANPQNFEFAPDSRSITLRVPRNRLAARSDEVLLARALRGFFGGWVFTPERTALRVLKLSPGNFSGKDALGSNTWELY